MLTGATSEASNPILPHPHTQHSQTLTLLYFSFDSQQCTPSDTEITDLLALFIEHLSPITGIQAPQGRGSLPVLLISITQMPHAMLRT